MKARLLTGFLGTALVLAPLVSAASPDKKSSGMSADMRRAIEFQQAKDRADARQARLEAKHPSVTYNTANREADRQDLPGTPVKDPGPKKK